MRSTHQGIILVDAQGTITFMDPVAANLLNITTDTALGHRLTEVYADTRILEVYTSGQALSCEQNVGETHCLIHYSPIIRQAQVDSVVVSIQYGTTWEQGPEGAHEIHVTKDIETLTVLTNLYEGILAELPLGMAVVNRQGRLVMMNQEYSRFIGVEEKQAIGLTLETLVPFSRLSGILSSGKPVHQKGIQYQGCTLFLSEMPIQLGGEVIGGLSKLLCKDGLEGQDFKALLERFQLLEGRLKFYKDELKELRRTQAPFEEIVGNTPAMRKLKQLAERVAKGNANVLITGESGTGKGMFAQAIHNASPRYGEPFIKINCAAIPDNLLESELFGYEEGAFTGALRGGKPGKFELANGGTIFLDEIGDMPLAMQAKILRVLQEKQFERVGGNKTLTVDVRVLAATNKDLKRLIEDHQFRLDLFYRLAVIQLHIPPLRDRGEDVVALAWELIRKLNIKYVQNITAIEPDVKHRFLTYAWPGNVRELENVLEHAFVFLEPEDNEVRMEHLPGNVESFAMAQTATGLDLDDIVAEAETEAIRQALKSTRGNKQEAARVLGIHVSGLYQKLKKYGITNP